MFRRQRGFVLSDSLNIHVNGSDTFKMIIFDLINSLFKCCFRFKIFFFKSVVHTKRIKILVKVCASLWIHGSRGDNFQMIIFDLINSLLKYWFMFEFWYFKAVVYNKRINFLVKGCDSWYIHGSRGNNFQIIIFDLINSLFKCWLRFEFWCFKDIVYTKWIKIIDGILTAILLITSVASERHGVFELIVTSSSSICSDTWCFVIQNPWNSSSVCSKFWSDLSNLVLSLVSK